MILLCHFNSGNWFESKTWYYNIEKQQWEEVQFISSGFTVNQNKDGLTVPGMKNK